MKKFIFAAVLLLCSCGGPKMDGNFPSNCYPYDMQIEVNKQEMLVKWQKNCKRNISGYNIYISETPLAPEYGFKQLPKEIAPFNETPYPGDTDPDNSIETFKAEGLTDGIKYYVSVRILLPNGVQSRPTNETPVVCGPRGEIELTLRFKSDHDGFSFKDKEFVRADDLKNDIYYFRAEGVDYLVSPVKLNGFLKDNKVQQLTFNGRLDQIKPNLSKLESNPTGDRSTIITGDWIRVYTPQGHNILLHVLGFSGEKEDRKVKLFYAYCGLKDELLF